jgi:hypothetical protein
VRENNLALITNVDLLVGQQEIGLIGFNEQLLELSEVLASTYKASHMSLNPSDEFEPLLEVQSACIT